MKIPIIWGCVAGLGCTPDRAAEDPVTRAGIEAALTPPARGALETLPGLPRGTQRLTVVSARVTVDGAPVSTLRDLHTAVVDAAGAERLDVWSLAATPVLVEDGRSCVRVGDEIFSGWRTRPPQRLRPQTRPARCLEADPLAELVTRFAPELATAAGPAFRLRDRERPPPDPIPLTWPTETDAPPLHPPRALLLVGHARPIRFAGRLEISPEGHLLGGRLDARFAIRKDGRDAQLDLAIRAWSRPFADRLEAPPEHTIEVARDRIVPRIEAVLGTLPADPTPLPGPGDAPPLKLPGEPHVRPGNTAP